MKTRFLSAKSLCAFIALGCFLFSKSAQAESAVTHPVTLSQSNDHVTLGNGIVSFEVVKTNGNIRDLKYGSVPIFAEPGYLDWISGGNNHIGNGEFAVVADPQKNGGEMCEVSITQKYAPDAKSSFDVELHYVLRRGDSGLYCFVVFSHAKDYPAGGIAQSRWVLRLDDKVFDFINVDEKRRRVMPPSNTPAKILGPKESSQFTEGPFKGFITDKYHFFVDVGDHFFHGWTSTQKHIGCWIVYGSNEAQNGGPTKQTNSAHFGRMLFKIITCGHYGGTTESVAAGQEWRKIYGPWMLYLNSGGNNDALWADAKKQAEKQRAAWPLAWMNHPEFPLAAMRGTVRGQLHISDPQDASASPRPSPTGRSSRTAINFGFTRTRTAGSSFPTSVPAITRSTLLPTASWTSFVTMALRWKKVSQSISARSIGNLCATENSSGKSESRIAPRRNSGMATITGSGGFG
jgi:rhamnogalacturonan endolyase